MPFHPSLLLLWLTLGLAIRMQSHVEEAKQDQSFLALHADATLVTASTWHLSVRRAGGDGDGDAVWDRDEQPLLMQLKLALKRDNCLLLDSTIAQTELKFKIYCRNASAASWQSLTADEVETFLWHTTREFLYLHFEHDALDMKRLQRIRRSHYGTYELLDYAMRIDMGLDPRLSRRPGAIKQLIPMPTSVDYEHMRAQDFVQMGAPWDLERINIRSGALSNEYLYMTAATDVDVYVVDTGALVTHQDFLIACFSHGIPCNATGGASRMTFLINTAGDGVDTDCAGHGTFVASEIGGLTYGVAKNVTLFAVKVLNCEGDGDTYGIEAGILQVLETAASRPGRRGVVNLSLGGTLSGALDAAVQALTQAGLVVTVSAGNTGQDACQFSPADLGGQPSAEVITVGASDSNDNVPSWSNRGACVSIGAPGDSVPGAWYTSDSATQLLSGTSMAAPLAAGVAALILAQDPTLSVAQVKNTILAWATPKILNYATAAGGGMNLLFSLINPATTPPPTAPVVPSIVVVINPDIGSQLSQCLWLLVMLVLWHVL
jgi:subtilisin family serine protease